MDIKKDMIKACLLDKYGKAPDEVVEQIAAEVPYLDVVREYEKLIQIRAISKKVNS